ncbi:MAG: hypothetical protein VX899_24425 [Myxococcota bacterium]|nr:hypothetical protein [Myxococcota bacterium]
MLLSLLLALTSENEAPSTGEARACVNNHVAEDYGDGWRVRNVGAFEVSEDNNRYMLLTLVSEVEYRFVSCGDARAHMVRIVVYDENGRLIADTRPEDGTVHEGRQAEMNFTPEHSGNYFVGVRLIEATPPPPETGKSGRRRSKGQEEEQAPSAAIGLGVLYR